MFWPGKNRSENGKTRGKRLLQPGMTRHLHQIMNDQEIVIMVLIF